MLKPKHSGFYATTLELQDSRGSEQAMRLFGLLKRNQQDVIESLATGRKEFLYESFSKALFDLETVNAKFEAYSPIVAAVECDLNLLETVKGVFGAPTACRPAVDPTVAEYLKNYQRPASERLENMLTELKQEQNRLTNRIRDQLWRYYPQALALGDLAADWFLELWQQVLRPLDRA